MTLLSYSDIMGVLRSCNKWISTIDQLLSTTAQFGPLVNLANPITPVKPRSYVQQNNARKLILRESLID